MTDLYWPFGLLARVDADWAQLASMAASGELPWEMLSAPLGSGEFEVRASAGVGIEHAVVSAVPRRNRLGLSMVRASLRAAQVAEVALRPSERPCLLRVDWLELRIDRKSTRLNSSHANISYAVFCLKKKKIR